MGGTKDFRGGEKALKSLIGAADVKWLGGRARLTPTHEWPAFSQSPATDLRKCLIAAILSSPEGKKFLFYF